MPGCPACWRSSRWCRSWRVPPPSSFTAAPPGGDSRWSSLRGSSRSPPGARGGGCPVARAGYFILFAIGFIAIAVGLELVPTLLHGFALTALPAFLARSLAVVCLGTGIGLLPFAFRMAAPAAAGARASDDDDELDEEDDGAWRLA